MIGMALAAEAEDHRIDLDGVDVLGAVPQRGRDVGAGAGAENQDVSNVSPNDRVRPLVEVFLLLDRRHRLVEDVVHLDDGVGAVLADGDLVVRRPDRAARHDVDDDQRRRQQRDVDGHRSDVAPERTAPSVGRRLARRAAARRSERDAEPPRRRQLRARKSRANAATPARLPARLMRVAAQRRQRRHLAPHALRQRREERRDDDEQQRQQHRALDQHDALPAVPLEK